jgi:hypothetical protein
MSGIARSSLILLLTVIFTSACKHEASPSQIAAQAKDLGVYVQVGNQLTEISSGQEEQRGIDGHLKGFKFTDPITVVPLDVSFVVNLPDAHISDSRIFWLPDVKSATWHVFPIEDGNHVDPEPVKASIEPIANGLYRVKPVVEGSNGTPFLCLWVAMPLGTADRLYAVQIKN